MRSWLIGALLVVIGLGLVFPVSSVQAEGKETTKVVIHYEPLEGDTTEWSLWVWGEGAEGSRYPFTSVDENGMKTAEIELPGQYSKVGFLVSTEDWIKDGSDQFIDVVNGVAEAHVIGGGLDGGEGTGNGPLLWLIVGLLLAVIYISVMEQLRRRRVAAA